MSTRVVQLSNFKARFIKKHEISSDSDDEMLDSQRVGNPLVNQLLVETDIYAMILKCYFQNNLSWEETVLGEVFSNCYSKTQILEGICAFIDQQIPVDFIGVKDDLKQDGKNWLRDHDLKLRPVGLGWQLITTPECPLKLVDN